MEWNLVNVIIFSFFISCGPCPVMKQYFFFEDSLSIYFTFPMVFHPHHRDFMKPFQRLMH